MPTYTCERCEHTFQQKGAHTRHLAKKIPCVKPPSAPAAPSTSPSSKKSLGQYFTISPLLQQFVADSVKYKGARLLEPSFGAAHLLTPFLNANPDYPMVCYELDSTIKPCVQFNEHQTVIYGDFTKQTITQRFKTIIGNPPYVKQSTGNLYIKFIDLCYNLLEPTGELIFIVPSDFLKLTSAASLITTMVANGSFTDFLFPQDERLFEGASIDVVVFRYEKGLLPSAASTQASTEEKPRPARVNGNLMLCTANKGILTFSQTELKGSPVSSLFNVYVGLVSGRDEIYRVPFGTMDILNDKDRVQRYIYADSFPTGNAAIDTHLEANKEALKARKIRAFNATNWFEWGAPRNKRAMEANKGKPCIYVRNMTRSKEVAFIGTVQYFGGSLLCLIPKDPATSLEAVVAHFQTPEFQRDYIYSGRFKIGHKQVSTAILPLL